MIRILLAVLFLTLAISAIGCQGPGIWFLEVAPVLIAIPFIVVFRQRMTPPLAILIAVHAAVLCLGAHYTYERVPGGEHIPFPWTEGRNNYDKIGHLFQGVTPGFIGAALLFPALRSVPPFLKGLLVVLAVLGISALYELIEMAAGIAMGEGADAFLGTQGFVWDTQTDMLMALVGAIIGVLLERCCARSDGMRALADGTPTGGG
jgi:putative membrane protein